MTFSARQQRQPLAGPQLAVDAYFDPDRFQREQARLFARSARYVGHERLVPEVGDYYVLPQEQGGRVLVRDAEGVHLLSNVCRHRQALMLGGGPGDVAGPQGRRGNLRAHGGHIVCPLHRWTYATDGRLVAAPQFPCKPESSLERFTLQNVNGMLFEGPRPAARELAGLVGRPDFDFSGYVLDHVEVHPCRYNWKTFIEVYLEDYHVGPFHPGLGRFVTCDDLEWEFTESYSLQRVGVHAALGQPGSGVYRDWQQRLLDYREGTPPDFGAIWVVYYPTHMIELYPHVLVLSTLYPQGPQETLNVVEFYYPEEIAAFEREFVEAQRAAYLETAIEDDEIAERMDAGRQALYRRGVSDAGPYQSPMEDGMAHFHDWYRRRMHELA